MTRAITLRAFRPLRRPSTTRSAKAMHRVENAGKVAKRARIKATAQLKKKIEQLKNEQQPREIRLTDGAHGIWREQQRRSSNHSMSLTGEASGGSETLDPLQDYAKWHAPLMPAVLAFREHLLTKKPAATTADLERARDEFQAGAVLLKETLTNNVVIGRILEGEAWYTFNQEFRVPKQKNSVYVEWAKAWETALDPDLAALIRTAENAIFTPEKMKSPETLKRELQQLKDDIQYLRVTLEFTVPELKKIHLYAQGSFADYVGAIRLHDKQLRLYGNQIRMVFREKQSGLPALAIAPRWTNLNDDTLQRDYGSLLNQSFGDNHTFNVEAFSKGANALLDRSK